MAVVSTKQICFERVNLLEDRALLAQEILEDEALAFHRSKQRLARYVASKPHILVFAGKEKGSSKAIGLYLRIDGPDEISIIDKFLFRGPPIHFFEQAVRHAMADAHRRSKSLLIRLYEPKPTLAFLS